MVSQTTTKERKTETMPTTAPKLAATDETTATDNPPTVDADHDPFDLERLRLSQDFVASANVRKVLTTVPVRKPAKEWFVRTHPSEEYRFPTHVVELKDDGEIYLVGPDLWDELSGESTFGPRALVTTISSQGVLFLWSIRLPGPDGKIDSWNASAMEASHIARETWVRVQSNRPLGAYEVRQALGDIPEPDWSIPPFRDLLQIAFRDRIIDSVDHPVLRRLRGEA